MNKSISSIVCLVVLVAAACNSSVVEARPKRSVYLAAAPVVAAAVPVVQTSHVVHTNPTSVVKTEQVRSGDHASYSYTSEVKTQPIVHTQTHAVAAAPVVAHAPVATAAVAAYPTAAYSAYYPYHHAYYPTAYSTGYSYYSPYSYVIGK